MIVNNVTSRLQTSAVLVASVRAAERQRVKEATRRLRTHAEKIAWHLAECRRQAAAF